MARSPSSGGGGSSILRKPTSQEASRRVGVFQFFGEVVGELKKVTWPTRQETARLTLLVFAISGVIGAILGVLDISFAKLLDIWLNFK